MKVFGISCVDGPSGRGTRSQCNLGDLGEGHGGAKLDTQLRARDTQPNFSGNRGFSDQSVGLVALSHDAAQRDLAGWDWGCHSRIEGLIRARHHIRTPAI